MALGLCDDVRVYGFGKDKEFKHHYMQQKHAEETERLILALVDCLRTSLVDRCTHAQPCPVDALTT